MALPKKMVEIIGAEAKIKVGRSKVRKERIRKGYRPRKLDLILRERRTRSEVRILNEARRVGVRVPKVIRAGKFYIEMEKIDGPNLRDVLGSLGEDERKRIFHDLGEQIGKLHSNNIIHGDLTTGNVILKGNAVYLIDFGLAFFSQKIEDKAVDLHLLQEALRSKHFHVWEECFNWAIQGYKDVYGDAEKVLRRVAEIEKRGRYVKRGI